jgi:hypothetical protein
MMDSNERMIKVQAELISDLRDQIKNLLTENNDLKKSYNKLLEPAHFYKLLEKSVNANPSLQNSWDDFIMVLRLVDPEIEKEFKNLNLVYYAIRTDI